MLPILDIAEEERLLSPTAAKEERLPIPAVAEEDALPTSDLRGFLVYPPFDFSSRAASMNHVPYWIFKEE